MRVDLQLFKTERKQFKAFLPQKPEVTTDFRYSNWRIWSSGAFKFETIEWNEGERVSTKRWLRFGRIRLPSTGKYPRSSLPKFPKWRYLSRSNLYWDRNTSASLRACYLLQPYNVTLSAMSAASTTSSLTVILRPALRVQNVLLLPMLMCYQRGSTNLGTQQHAPSRL